MMETCDLTAFVRTTCQLKSAEIHHNKLQKTMIFIFSFFVV